MGTIKHSRASKKRWAQIPKEEKRKRMSAASKSGWSQLSARQRRLRALKGVQTRTKKLLGTNDKQLHE